MKNKLLLIPVLVLFAGKVEAQWGGGGTFRFFVSGSATAKTDSIRLKGGGSTTITLSGNEATISSTVAAGSVDSTAVANGGLINADIRVSTLDSSRVAPSGLTQSDIRVSALDSSRIAPNGLTQADIRVSTLDSSRIAPGGITQSDIRVSSLDSSRIVPGGLTQSDIRVSSLDSTRIVPGGITSSDIRVSTLDSSRIITGGIAPNDLALSKVFAWTGNHSFTAIVTKLDLLDLAAGMWLNSPTTGTVDSTVAGIPMKMFSTSDTAFCDIFLPAHFSSLDSIVVLGGTISTLGDSAAFSIQVKTVARRGAYVGAFNTAAIDSSDLGTANTQAFWKFTSFGTVTAFKTLRIKMWRSACTNNTGSDVYMERVILYGKGLR